MIIMSTDENRHNASGSFGGEVETSAVPLPYHPNQNYERLAYLTSQITTLRVRNKVGSFYRRCRA